MRMPPAPYTQEGFAHSPFVAFYEVTRACDLACKHCRACAQPLAHPNQLTNEQSKQLLDQFASFPHKPVLVFTGGDPLKRPDVFDLVKHAVDAGLATAMTPSATPLVTTEALQKLKAAGLSRFALSIDSSDPDTHDAFRGVPGSFNRTIEILKDAQAVGMPLQVNTTITSRNVDQIDAMADMMATLGITLWSVFFLIPVGRGRSEERIHPEQYETVFSKLWNHANHQPYTIKTTEAPHYRRFVMNMEGDPLRKPVSGPDSGRIQRAPLGVNDGKGVMFVSHTGTVYPSGFLPIACGKFPEQSIVDVYQNAPTFRQLRDPLQLQGKCGDCEFNPVCGGSRARAYAVTGNVLAQEPDCGYIPRKWRELATCSA